MAENLSESNQVCSNSATNKETFDLTVPANSNLESHQYQDGGFFMKKEELLPPTGSNSQESTEKTAEITTENMGLEDEEFEIPVTVVAEETGSASSGTIIPVHFEESEKDSEEISIPIEVVSENLGSEANEGTSETVIPISFEDEESEPSSPPSKKESLAYAATVFMDRMSMGQITDIHDYSSWLRNYEEQLVPLPLREVLCQDSSNLVNEKTSSVLSNNRPSVQTSDDFEKSLSEREMLLNSMQNSFKETKDSQEYDVPLVCGNGLKETTLEDEGYERHPNDEAACTVSSNVTLKDGFNFSSYSETPAEFSSTLLVWMICVVCRNKNSMLRVNVPSFFSVQHGVACFLCQPTLQDNCRSTTVVI